MKITSIKQVQNLYLRSPKFMSCLRDIQVGAEILGLFD